MLLIDGRILGGDAFFYYLGSYSSADGRWKGEMLNQEHTPAKGENPVFGGFEVGIGFSGTCTEDSGELEGIALAGKRSLRLAASLRLMRWAKDRVLINVGCQLRELKWTIQRYPFQSFRCCLRGRGPILFTT